MSTHSRSVERELLWSSVALSRGQRLEDVQDIDADVPEIVELRLEAARLHQHLQQLDPRLQHVVRLIYGLDGLPLGHELIARCLGLTPRDIATLEQQALARLSEIYEAA